MVDETRVREIVERVVARLQGSDAGCSTCNVPAAPAAPSSTGGGGVFEDVDSAVAAAQKAQKELISLPLEKRKSIVAHIREVCRKENRRFAEITVSDTKMGRVEDKVVKNGLSIEKTPGPECLEPLAMSGDDGLTIEEYIPYGVIGSLIPCTNPVATVINHAIMMLSAGNTIVFSPHPASVECSLEGTRVIHRAIVEAGGPANAVTMLSQATLRNANLLIKHTDIDLLCATGGEAVVRACMQSGKRSVAAAPGNPPALVDETADIALAAKAICDGCSFDNNMPCVCEKEVLVVDSVADALIREMEAYAAYRMSPEETEAVRKIVLDEEEKLNRDAVGKNIEVILGMAGMAGITGIPSKCKLAICETDLMHPFVQHELMMPILPIVRCRDYEEAVQFALQAEHGFRHTAIIHTKDMNRVTDFSRRIQTTLMAVNGPCGVTLGAGGEGWSSMTISGPTGEGVTTPKSFSKRRRVAFAGTLRLV